MSRDHILGFDLEATRRFHGVYWHPYSLTCRLYHCLLYTSDAGTWHVITWHLIPDTWYMTLDMLSPGTSTSDLILWHLTGYYYTWHLYYIAYSWLSLLRGLWHDNYTATIWYSCTPELLYSCIPCTHVSCIVTLVNSTVIPASGRACLVSGWRECITRSC